MGVRGRRTRIEPNTTYSEPDLIAGVDDILSKASIKGYLDSNENIDLDKVAHDNNIEVRYEVMEPSQSGYFRCVDGVCVIGVNSQHNKRRRRFTLAHELGHFFLHKEKNTLYADEVFFRIDNSSSIEYAANEFAARLLMPEQRISALIEQGFDDLSSLAEKLDVSIAAIRYRVVSLGYSVSNNE